MAAANNIRVGIERTTLYANNVRCRLSASHPSASIERLLFNFKAKRQHTASNPVRSGKGIVGVPKTVAIVLQVLHGGLHRVHTHLIEHLTNGGVHLGHHWEVAGEARQAGFLVEDGHRAVVLVRHCAAFD